MQNNIIKEKVFHVEEDFYEQIINGLQTEKERDAARNEKRPVIILPKQARFISYVTTPIITKQATGLIESVTRTQYEQEKLKAQYGLKSKFVKAWEKFANLDDEADKEIEEIDTKKSGSWFGLFGVMRLLKLFRTISRIYQALKFYKKPQKSNKIDFDIGNLNNQYQLHQIETSVTEALVNQGQALVPVITQFMFPTAKELFTMYDLYLEKLYAKFWIWIIKTLIFDPSDPVDVAFAAVSLALTFTGVGAVGGAALMGGRIIAKIGKAAPKLYKLFKVGEKFQKTIKIIGGTMKKTAKGVKWAANKAWTPTKKIGESNLKHGIRTFERRRKIMRGVRGVYMGIDFFDVTEQDRREYHEYFKRIGRVLGSRVEAKYTDDIIRMINTGVDIFDFGHDELGDKLSGMFNSSKENQIGLISKTLSDKFGRTVLTKGFSDLQITKILMKLDSFFTFFFKRVLNGMTPWKSIVSFNSKNEMQYENKVLRINDDGLYAKFDDNTAINLTLNKTGRNTISFENNNQTIKTKEFTSKSNHALNVDRNLLFDSNYKVQRDSFKRIYRNGFAIGFEVKIGNHDLSKHKIIKNGGEVVAHDDGVISFTHETKTTERENINKIISSDNNIIKYEKESASKIKKINDLLEKAALGINVVVSNEIVDKPKKSFMERLNEALAQNSKTQTTISTTPGFYIQIP